MKKPIASLIAALICTPLWAVPQTVTLSVPGMNCVTCPITIKKALTKIAGVEKAEINLDRREAKVSFDDAKTTAQALMQATKDAGYPSSLAGASK